MFMFRRRPYKNIRENTKSETGKNLFMFLVINHASCCHQLVQWRNNFGKDKRKGDFTHCTSWRPIGVEVELHVFLTSSLAESNFGFMIIWRPLHVSFEWWEIIKWVFMFLCMGEKLGRWHCGRKGSWGCLRTWCWGEYFDLGGTR